MILGGSHPVVVVAAAQMAELDLLHKVVEQMVVIQLLLLQMQIHTQVVVVVVQGTMVIIQHKSVVTVVLV